MKQVYRYGNQNHPSEKEDKRVFGLVGKWPSIRIFPCRPPKRLAKPMERGIKACMDQGSETNLFASNTFVETVGALDALG